MYSHWFLTKSQARLCPTLLAATDVMTEVASCLRIMLEFKVNDRYLWNQKKQEVILTALIQPSIVFKQPSAWFCSFNRTDALWV